MAKGKVFCILMLFFCSLQLQSEVFEFLYTVNDQYRLVTEVSENIYIDGKFNNRADILNKISVEILAVKESAGLLYGVFQVSEKAWGESGPYRMKDEVYTSRFWRDQRGRYEIASHYMMPVVRNVPTFPDREINTQDSWAASADEVHDLKSFGIAQPLHVPLQVTYTYRGNEMREGVELAIIEIHYSASKNLRDAGRQGVVAPVKIKGSSDQLYYWDIDKGRPYAYQDTFGYIYVFSNGRVVEFEGTSEGRVVQAERLDRQKVLEDIQQEIEQKRIPDASVVADDSGITITLDNISFPPESAYLAPAERSKLDKIAEILMQYPERDLLIVGHTALAGTAEGRQTLSEKRAQAVGSYLLSNAVRDKSQIVYKGMGASQPISENNTEAGRRKNRRVEIKMLEN